MPVKTKIDEKILKEIVHAIEAVNYGEVVVTIHQAKIVQIEKKDKKRFG